MKKSLLQVLSEVTDGLYMSYGEGQLAVYCGSDWLEKTLGIRFGNVRDIYNLCGVEFRYTISNNIEAFYYPDSRSYSPISVPSVVSEINAAEKFDYKRIQMYDLMSKKPVNIPCLAVKNTKDISAALQDVHGNVRGILNEHVMEFITIMSQNGVEFNCKVVKNG